MAEYSSTIEEYDFNHKYRGQALIFIHSEFDEFNPRYGASKDLESMRIMFSSLDFKVKVYKNLSSKVIMDKLKKAANCEYNKQSDCFACVFSTHGSEEREINRKQNFVTWKNAVYGKDCTPIFVDDILDIFSNRKCPSLMDKPKLFFIQACRTRHGQSDQSSMYDFGKKIWLKTRQQSRNSVQGSQLEGTDSLDDTCTETLYKRQPGEEDCSQGHLGGTAKIETATSQMTLEDSDIKNLMNIYEDWIEDEDPDEFFDDNEEQDEFFDENEEQENDMELEADETDLKTGQDSQRIPDLPVELTPVNCPNDCLVVYPVMSGKLALRSRTKGSWLLHYLFENLKHLINRRSLLQYLTKVCFDIAEKNFSPRPLNEGIIPEKRINTKVTAHLIHKLSKDVKFTPKKENTCMDIWYNNFFSCLLKRQPKNVM